MKELNSVLAGLKFDATTERSLRQVLYNEMEEVKQGLEKGMEVILPSESQRIAPNPPDISAHRIVALPPTDDQEVNLNLNPALGSQEAVHPKQSLLEAFAPTSHEASGSKLSRRTSLIKGPRDSLKVHNKPARRHTQSFAGLPANWTKSLEAVQTSEGDSSIRPISTGGEPSVATKPILRVDIQSLAKPISALSVASHSRLDNKTTRTTRRASLPLPIHQRAMSDSGVAAHPSRQYARTAIRHTVIAEVATPPSISPLTGRDDVFGSSYGGFDSAEEAQAFVAEQREKYELLSLTNVTTQFVPEAQREEYNKNFGVLFGYVLDVERNLELRAHTLAREDVRRLIAVCVSTRVQQNLLDSKDPSYMWDLKAVCLMTKQMKIASDDFRPH